MRHLASLLFCLPVLLSSQTIWFEDRFDSSTLSEPWNAPESGWAITTGGLQIAPAERSLFLSSSFYLTDRQTYRIEMEVRGSAAGIFFALDDQETSTVSQLVRMESARVLSGYIIASGEYVITYSSDSVFFSGTLIRLRLDVEPQMRRCAIFINDQRIGVDTSLQYRAGYLGLQMSDGATTVRSVRVTADAPQEPNRRPPVGSPVHFNRVRFVRSSGANVQIYNPEIRYVQTIRPDGTLQGQSQTFRPPRGPLQAMAGDRIYEVGRSFLLVKDTRGRVLDTVRSHLLRPSAIIAISSTRPHQRSKAAAPAGKTLLLVADAGARAILTFSGNGEYISEDRAADIGGFRAPRGLDIMPSGEIVVADHDRLVFRSLDRPDAPSRLILGQSSNHPMAPSAASSVAPFLDPRAER